jgi:hypothetical protein
MRISVEERDHWDAKVFLNGKDVSAQCRKADDKEGWAELMGKPPIIKNGEVVFTRCYGSVVIDL